MGGERAILAARHPGRVRRAWAAARRNRAGCGIPSGNRLGGGTRSTEAQWHIGSAQTRRFCPDRELGGFLKALYFLNFCHRDDSERMLQYHESVNSPLRFRHAGPACSTLHSSARLGPGSAARTI
jgi:hypothetical protein